MTPEEALEILEPELCDLPESECLSSCYTKRDALAVLRAVLVRDADVRTLDEYTRTMPTGYSPPVAMPADPLGPPGSWAVFVCAYPFFGATPDEARAKAAAWVRDCQNLS